MTVMSGPTTNLNTFIPKQFGDIFASEVNPEQEIASDDPKLIQFNRFLDSVIKIGAENEGLSKSQSLTQVTKFIESNANLDNSLLKNALNQALLEKRNQHVNYVDNALSSKLRQNADELSKLTELMDANIKPGVAGAKEYANSTKADMQEDFAFHMKKIGEEILELPLDQRESGIAPKIAQLTKEMVVRYGSKNVQSFSDSVKDSQLASYIYLEEDNTDQKLPAFKLNEDAKDILETADFSGMSTDDKKEVVDLIESFFKPFNEKDAALTEEGKYHFDQAFSKLKPEQQAFYEQSRSQAEEISKIASNPMDLISSLANKLPNLLLPGIIGAVVSYVMGFGSIGGIAGVVLSGLGEAEISPPDKKISLPKPPIYRVAA